MKYKLQLPDLVMAARPKLALQAISKGSQSPGLTMLHRLLKQFFISSAFTLLMISGDHSAFSQTPEIAPDPTQESTMNTYRHILMGHTFLPSFTVPNPFSNSNAQLAVGFAYGDYPAGQLQLADNLKLAAFSPRIDGQVSIIKPLAISFGLNATAIAGIDAVSILQYGASTLYSFRVGLTFELLRLEQQVLSVALDLDRPHTYAVSPLVAAKQFIRDLTANVSATYVNSDTESQWRPSLRYALAFSPSLGLQAFAGFRFLTSSQSEGSNSRFAFGATLEAALKPMTEIPLTVTISYLRGQPLSSGAPVNSFSFGLYETLRNPFNMGLEVGNTAADNLNTTVGFLTIRVYYN